MEIVARRSWLATSIAVPPKSRVRQPTSHWEDQAKVEDKALPAEAKDQVKVGRSEGTGKSVESGKLADEDKVARDKAYKEAQERVALLWRKNM